jgi:hypothetical protein
VSTDSEHTLHVAILPGRRLGLVPTLVEFEVNVPDGAPGSEVEARNSADSEAQLAGLLRALPLYDWMHVTVTPLEAHPSDPAPPVTGSAAARSQR